MTTHDNFIVAVELGSSKVSAVAGEKQPDGAIRILAATQEPSETFIRKGRIYNIDKFGLCLERLKNKLEKSVGMSIAKAYVGVGGMGMHSVLSTVVKTFPERVKVTEEMIDMIQDENSVSQPSDRDIIGVVPQEYKLDAHKTVEPVGVLTQTITGNFLNIVAAAQTKQQIVDHFAHGRIEVVDLPITFLSLADNIVAERNRQSGCVFVDMGAQTTSVAIFKSGLLRHLAVIPLGGHNITTDISTSYQIDEDEAEELKLKYNFAIENIDKEDHATFTLSDGRTKEINDLKKLVSARLEEIILNVKHQIELSQYTLGQLVNGIILTGGVAQTRGIENAFKTITGIQAPVTLSRGISIAVRTGKQDFNKDKSYDSVISLVAQGSENCCGGPIGQSIDIFDAAKQTPEPPVEHKQTEEVPSATPPTPQEGRISGGDIAADVPNVDDNQEDDKNQKPNVIKESFGKLSNKFKGFLNNLIKEDD